jgi:hypothetical protein
MKPVVAFVIAFVVGTGATTGAKVAMTKQAPARAEGDSTKAHKDSTQTDTALVASGHEGAVPGDSAHRAAVSPDSAKPAVAPAVAAGAKAPGAAAAPVVQAGVPESAVNAAIAAANAADTLRDASQRRIAKVFTSMDAKQAAKVLEHMTDNDVQIILGYVGPRPAAAILAELPPERSATLSKLALQGKKK